MPQMWRLSKGHWRPWQQLPSVTTLLWHWAQLALRHPKVLG